MRDDTRIALVERLAAERPNPESELDHNSPFELLIAVMLSAQTTDKKVNTVTPALFRAAPDAQSLAAMDIQQIESYIRTIGLYHNKAKNIKATAAILAERHQGRVPETLDELTALPGVGEKTAKVVLNVAFGKPVMPVDTHIFRVSNRTGIAPGATPSEVGHALEKLLPERLLGEGHHWILLHGRYCCQAQKPDCAHCPVLDLCEYPDKNL